LKFVLMWLLYVVLGPGTCGTCRCVGIDVRTVQRKTFGGELEDKNQVGWALFFYVRARDRERAWTGMGGTDDLSEEVGDNAHPQSRLAKLQRISGRLTG
jgi:hypothetical protein